MFCLRTSAVECTHQSLLEELWLRVHRSPHQEQRLLQYNEKGRITQNTAEQSTVKESNAFKSLNLLSVSQHCILMYCMPHDSLRTKTVHYITIHFTLHSYCISHYYHGILQLVLYVYISSSLIIVQSIAISIAFISYSCKPYHWVAGGCPAASLKGAPGLTPERC